MVKSKANKKGCEVFTKQMEEWQKQTATITSALSIALEKAINVVELEAKKEVFEDIEIIRNKYRNSGFDFQELDDLRERHLTSLNSHKG